MKGLHHYFNLEDPTDLQLLSNPKLALEDLEGLIVIDEIQRLSEIYPYLRVKADKMGSPARHLVVGENTCL